MKAVLRMLFWLAASGLFIFVCIFVWYASHPEDFADSSVRNYDEAISPVELSKNPYRTKGHYGTLDARCLSYEKMIDEHSATYEVLCGGGLFSSSEIAVDLEDSDPPKTDRPWHVYVVGPREAETVLGAKINVSVVRFDGYGKVMVPTQPYIPPPPAPVTPLPASTPPETTEEPEPHVPAPIERRSPETARPETPPLDPR